MESKGFPAPWEWLMDRTSSYNTAHGAWRKWSRMRVFLEEMMGASWGGAWGR